MPLPPSLREDAPVLAQQNNNGEVEAATISTHGHEQDGTAGRKSPPPSMHLQQDNNSMTMHDRTPTKGPLETGLCRNAPTTTPPHTPPPVGERERAEREEVNIDRIECNVDRVDKKKKLKSDSVRWTLATQNFRGLTSEEAREEVALQMERASIDVVCGQETWTLPPSRNFPRARRASAADGPK